MKSNCVIATPSMVKLLSMTKSGKEIHRKNKKQEDMTGKFFYLRQLFFFVSIVSSLLLFFCFCFFSSLFSFLSGVS